MSDELSTKKAKTVKVSVKPKVQSIETKSEPAKENELSENKTQASNNTVCEDKVAETTKEKKSSSNKRKRNIALAVVALLALILIVASLGNSDQNASDPNCTVYAESQTNVDVSQNGNETTSVSYVSDSNSVWLNGYTDINDFEYYIDGSDIYIKKYKGNSDKVRVAPTYVINGATCNVVSFEDATFLFSNVNSVIIPNGTKYLANNTFNTSGVTFLYLPNTLTGIDNTFWGYFHGVQKIYFGGSQEEWNSIYNNGSANLDAKEIIFNQNPDDLK